MEHALVSLCFKHRIKRRRSQLRNVESALPMHSGRDFQVKRNEAVVPEELRGGTLRNGGELSVDCRLFVSQLLRLKVRAVPLVHAGDRLNSLHVVHGTVLSIWINILVSEELGIHGLPGIRIFLPRRVVGPLWEVRSRLCYGCLRCLPLRTDLEILDAIFGIRTPKLECLISSLLIRF